MSVTRDIFRAFGSLTGGLLGGGGLPQVQAPVAIPSPAQAAPAGDAARRAFTAKGRGGTILTSELGASNILTSAKRTLLGIR